MLRSAARDLGDGFGDFPGGSPLSHSPCPLFMSSSVLKFTCKPLVLFACGHFINVLKQNGDTQEQ